MRNRTWALTLASLGWALAAAADEPAKTDKTPDKKPDVRDVRPFQTSNVWISQLMVVSHNPVVIEELKISDDELKKLEEKSGDLRKKLSETYKEVDWKDRVALRKFRLQQRDIEREFVQEVIGKERTDRLVQIQLQLHSNPSYLHYDEVMVAELKITEDQIKARHDLNAEYFKKMKEVRTEIKDDTKKMMEKYAEVNKELNEQVAKLLTEDQKKAYEQMLGPKFDRIDEARKRMYERLSTIGTVRPKADKADPKPEKDESKDPSPNNTPKSP